jgi:hypothetical protein
MDQRREEGETLPRTGRCVLDANMKPHPALFPDTDPNAEAVLIELLRHTPAWRKLQMVDQMNQAVRALTLSGLRQRYPDAGAGELDRRLADLFLGPGLAAQVYGPLDPLDGPERADVV